MRTPKLKLFALALATCTVVLVNSGCPNCKEVTKLCDLLIQSFTAPAEVNIGQAFDAVTNIGNDEDDASCSVTDLAATTYNLLEVFQLNSSGQWDFIGELAGIFQPEIGPGSSISMPHNVKINQSGDFRLDYYDDNQDNVSERNENNNIGHLYGKTAGIKTYLRTTNNFASVYVRVNPLPNGTTQLEGRPEVEFK